MKKEIRQQNEEMNNRDNNYWSEHEQWIFFLRDNENEREILFDNEHDELSNDLASNIITKL